MVDGVMKMRPLADGIEIKPGETVTLKKGGLHLMFMKLKEQMEVGQMRKAILTFEKQGSVEIDLMVVDPAEMDGEDGMDHSGHSN
jgi:copper(I)-binding protein